MLCGATEPKLDKYTMSPVKHTKGNIGDLSIQKIKFFFYKKQRSTISMQKYKICHWTVYAELFCGQGIRFFPQKYTDSLFHRRNVKYIFWGVK